MPESNARLVEAAFAAVNRRDADALTALCTPDVEFRPILASPSEEAYRGAEGVRRWLAEVDQRLPDGRALPDEIEERGDVVLVSGVTRGPGLMFHWHLAARIEGGLIAAWSFHPTREHAERSIEAAG